MNKIKKYSPAILSGAAMLVAAPFFFFMIFLGGDSCCGENTSGNMLLVTAFITGILFVPSLLFNLFFKLILINFLKGSSLILSILITWVIAAGIYWPYVIFLIITAFYI